MKPTAENTHEIINKHTKNAKTQEITRNLSTPQLRYKIPNKFIAHPKSPHTRISYPK